MSNQLNVVAISAPGRHEDKVIRYVDKKDYGKIPAYLSRVKNIIEEEKSLVAKLCQSAHDFSAVTNHVTLAEVRNKLNIILLCT